MSDNYIKFWADNSTNFKASEAQDNTLYFVTDIGEVYKGGQLIANKINKAKVDATNIGYGTCSTAANVANKEVTLDAASVGWELTVGSLLTVKFTNTNSAASPKLKVENTIYPIYYNNAEYTGSSSYGGYKDRHITYQFNGTHWVFISWSYICSATGSAYEPIYINSNHAPAKCSSPSAIVNLASEARDGLFKAQPSLGVTGILPVAHGGTGKATLTSDYVLSGNGTDPIKSTNLKITGTQSLIESTTTADVKHVVKNSSGSVSLWASTNRGLRDETSNVWIIASNQAGTATYVDRWKSTGSDSQPVYFNSTGSPVAVDSAATSNAFLNALGTGSSNPQDGDYFISQYAGGGTGGSNASAADANKFYRRPVSALYNYIVGKADKRYVKLTDAQTVAGVKTFTSNPVVSNSSARVKMTDGVATIWAGIAKGTSSSGAEYYNAGIYDNVGEGYIIRGLLNATTGAVDSVAIGKWSSTGSTYVPVYFNSSGAPTACTSPSMLTNLGSTTAANVFAASPRPGITGTLAVSHGGTGATSLTSDRVLVGKGTSAIAASNLSISSYHAIFTASDGTASYYKAENSNGAVSVYVYTHRGLWDSTNGAWMIYREKGSTTTLIPGTVNLTGTVKIDSGKGSRLTVTTPSKTLWFGGNGDDDTWGIYNATNTQYLVYQNSDGIFVNGKANALKLSNAIGGSSTPVYFNASGKPVACSKDIPTVYAAADCSAYTTDTGTCTPAAVKKAVTSFAVLKDSTTQTILGHKTFTGDLDFLPSTPGTGTIGSLDNPAAYLTAEAVRCTYPGHGTNYARLAVYADGTTSEVGNGRLYVGNNTSSGTKGNARGSICMYGQTTGYCVITAYDTYIAFSFGGV
jgi:ribosomal protein L27